MFCTSQTLLFTVCGLWMYVYQYMILSLLLGLGYIGLK